MCKNGFCTFFFTDIPEELIIAGTRGLIRETIAMVSGMFAIAAGKGNPDKMSIWTFSSCDKGA
jgi:hypothetical protein